MGVKIYNKRLLRLPSDLCGQLSDCWLRLEVLTSLPPPLLPAVGLEVVDWQQICLTERDIEHLFHFYDVSILFLHPLAHSFRSHSYQRQVRPLLHLGKWRLERGV
jgi:hypothetical protein